MAKAYKATTRIDGGRQTAEGVEKYDFFPGDIVKGLTKDEMKQLWEAGALESVDVVEVTKEESQDSTPSEPAA